MVTINRKRPGDSTYVGTFGDKEIIVHAVSINQARQKTLEHFGPKKKERDLIKVKLTSEE